MKSIEIHLRKQVTDGKDGFVVSDSGGGNFGEHPYRRYDNARREALYRRENIKKRNGRNPSTSKAPS